MWVNKAFTCKTGFLNSSYLLAHFVYFLALLLWCHFSASCCPPAVQPPAVRREKSKSIQTRTVMREQTQYPICPHRKHVKMRDVSGKEKKENTTTILAKITEPSNVQVLCEERGFCAADYSQAAACLSLFLWDECDFLLSYNRQLTFTTSRWFTVRLSSSSA